MCSAPVPLPPTGYGNPTPYPEVNALLARLLAELRAVLGDQLFGLYLYGSLAGGGFAPGSSDVDFLAVTVSALDDARVAALGEMHARLAACGLAYAGKLEGTYLPLVGVRRYTPDGPPWPTFNEGRFYTAPHGPDWIIQRHVLREHEIAVAGPPLRPYIDPVAPAALRGAVTGVLHGWWAEMAADPAPLRRTDYQAFAVLTMCRALFALRHGEILSKPAAARWAQEALGPDWAPVIAEALAWRYGHPLDLFDAALAMIRMVLAEAGDGSEHAGQGDRLQTG